MSVKSESYILCEGYHDRAFLAAWLEYFGCTDPGAPTPDRNRRVDVPDPWGDPVVGKGQYALHSRAGHFIRIVPCNGKGNLNRQARQRISKRLQEPLSHLVVAMDADVSVDNGVTVPVPGAGEVRTFFSIDAQVTQVADSTFRVNGENTELCILRWQAHDPDADGLPRQQTLERLVCASIVAAYPPRARDVQTWLTSRSDPPEKRSPKEHAWSYMAGWYAEHGCEDFYREMWREPKIVEELKKRLSESGAWNIAERIAGAANPNAPDASPGNDINPPRA